MDRGAQPVSLTALRGDRSQKEVAAAVRVSRSALAMYERGERLPRDEVKSRLARYYGRRAEDIFLPKNATISDDMTGGRSFLQDTGEAVP